jgi:type II secretory pathway pseudopilin PulG
MQIIPKSTAQQGFSLIQVSILIAVAGIMLASVLPGGELGSDINKNRITKEKMEKIEAATQSFMAANLRRPCPADGTLAIGSANFGVEDTTAGRCSNSNFYVQSVPVTKTGATTSASTAIATTLSNTTGLSIGMLVTGTNIADDTHIASVDSDTQITLNKYAAGASGTLTFTSVAAGVVPTKTLGLPDDYMFDGYGRRISYMVDIRATDQTTCRDMQTTKTNGAIQIMDSAAAIYTTDNVMWSLISYGKNGHGAFSMQGTSIANRMDSGATNDDERTNAFVDASFVTTFTPKLVKHEPISTSGTTYFDDTIWTQESSKNTCCTGKICMAGTRIDEVAIEKMGNSAAIGDINGDGISDMVLPSMIANTIRVVFGSATGWSPSTGMSMGTENSSRFITITNNSGYSNFPGSVAAGDINGDGYDDIAIGYGNGASSAIKIFYGSATPVSTNTSAMTNTITFPPTSGSDSPNISLGNFANTTKKDILATVKIATGAGNSTAYVIYGAASYALTAEAVTTVAATVGFKINTSTGKITSPSNSTGDLNNDGYEEIIIRDYTSGNKAVYVLFGQSPANWNTDKTTAATGSTPDIINIDTRVAAGGTEAVRFTSTGIFIGMYTMAVADMNNDGIKDLILNSAFSHYVYYGKVGGWSNVDLAVASNYDGVNGMIFYLGGSCPSWWNLSAANSKAIAKDINGDGKTDIVFTHEQADPDWAFNNSGTSFVALQPSAGWSSLWSPTLGASGVAGTLNLCGDIFDATGTALPLNNDVSKGFRIDGAAAVDLQ